MSNFGFVYILTNDAIPDMFKVGCTERSPSQRAAELSSGTAVPLPFSVSCYAEFADFQSIEHRLHHWLSGWRVSESREFFYRHDVDPDKIYFEAVGYLAHHPSALAFTTTANLLGELGPDGFKQLTNPWAKQKAITSNVVELALPNNEVTAA